MAEQLGWRLPEQVVIPVASGSLLTKVDKAFGELGGLGLVEPDARTGSSAPRPRAARRSRRRSGPGIDVIRPVKPNTIAKSLAIGNPADGPYALDVARRTGGAIADVSDEEIVAGIRLLAQTEGIFAETAGGVTVATLRQLLASGQLDPDAETVVYNTGDGLKTLDAVAPRSVRRLPFPHASTSSAPPSAAEDPRSDSPAPHDEEPPMSVAVRIPTILRSYTAGVAEVSVEPASPPCRRRSPRSRPPTRACRRACSTTRARCAGS